MKKLTRLVSGFLSAALIFEFAVPGVQQYIAAADETIESMSMVIKSGFEKYETEIDITKFGIYYTGDKEKDGESAARIQEIISYVYSDPELFYLKTDNNYKIHFQLDENSNQWMFASVSVNYLNTYEEVIPLKEEFNNKVDEIIDKEFNDGMTELQKVLKAHDYLALNTKYDTTGEIPDYNGGSSAYDVLVCGNGVCQGYAQAFNVLMDRLGMESIMVTSRDMNHAWNLVSVDGEWYHIDATWDDPTPDRKGLVNHKYFMLSDEAISQKGEYRDYTHYSWDSKGFKATSTKYDNAFWGAVSTEMFIEDGKWYYVDRNGVYSTYVEATGETNTFVSVCEENWPVYGATDGSYYLDKYTTLIVSGNTIYFNTPTQIYSMKLDGSEKRGLQYINPYDVQGYVYGLTLKDNVLYAVIKQDPKDEGTLYEAMNLELDKFTVIDMLQQTIDSLAEGQSATVQMDTETIVPAAAIESMKDRDITITLDLGDYNWKLSGKKIDEAKDLNLEIKQDQGIIPDDMLNSILDRKSQAVELNLTHNGPFGLKADINYDLGEKFAENVAVLYYYNEANNTMDELDFMMVDRFGKIDITLEHASSYALVLRDMRAPDDPITDEPEKPPQVEEPEVTTTPVTSEPETVITESTSESTVTMGELVPSYVLGDANMDGIVDLMDLSTVSLVTLNEATLEGDAYLAADVNRDGKVNLQDITMLKQYVMNKISSFE